MDMIRSFFLIEIPGLIYRLSSPISFFIASLRASVRVAKRDISPSIPYSLTHSPEGRILYLTLQFSSSDLDGGSFVSTRSRAFLSTPAYLKFVCKSRFEI